MSLSARIRYVSEMSLTFSNCFKALSLESPFSHFGVYGIDHPTFGKVSNRKTASVNRSSNHNSQSSSISSIKPSRSSVSITSKTSAQTSSSKMSAHRKKKKKRSDRNATLAHRDLVKKETHSRVSFNQRTLFHSVNSPPGGSGTSLVRVERDSPVLSRQKPLNGPNKQEEHWKRRWQQIRPIQSPSESTSGYTSLYHSNKAPTGSKITTSNSKTAISSSSISKSATSSSSISKSATSSSSISKPTKSSSSISKSATSSSSIPKLSGSVVSHNKVTFSFNSSQHKRKSQIVNSPINVSLKRATQTTSSLHPPSIQPRRVFGVGSCSKRSVKAMTVEDIAWGLGRLQYRQVIVMTGAGISTPSGIPDFRSPGTGLYDNLQQYKIPDPTAIFDIGYFARNPKPFFTLAKELYPGNYNPNHIHYLVRLLQEKGILLRNYTQNIDGLERIAGISPSKLVEAHGSFSTASCIKCKSKQDSEEVKACVFTGKIPRCKHKHCLGLVKPDIVFFGEDLPPRFHSLQLRDFSKCDLVIIMGTSLEVEPFASLSTLSRFDVPRLLINRDLVGPFKQHRKRVTDVAMLCDLVQGVCRLLQDVGWMDDLQRLMGEVSCEEIESSTDIVPSFSLLDVQTVASEDTSSARLDHPVLQVSPSPFSQTEPTTNTNTHKSHGQEFTDSVNIVSQMADVTLESNVEIVQKPPRARIPNHHQDVLRTSILESVPKCEPSNDG